MYISIITNKLTRFFVSPSFTNELFYNKLYLQQEELVVNKKQPNVLDKPKGGNTATVGGGKTSGAGQSALSQDVDVRKLTVCL